MKEKDTSFTKSPYLETRNSELNSTLSFFRESIIFIIKEGMANKDLLKEDYIQSVKDIELELDLVLMDEKDVNQIIRS